MHKDQKFQPIDTSPKTCRAAVEESLKQLQARRAASARAAIIACPPWCRRSCPAPCVAPVLVLLRAALLWALHVHVPRAFCWMECCCLAVSMATFCCISPDILAWHLLLHGGPQYLLPCVMGQASSSQHQLVCVPAHCLQSFLTVLKPHGLLLQTDYIDILILRAHGSQSNTPLEEVMQGMKARAHGRLARAQQAAMPCSAVPVFCECSGTVSGAPCQLLHCPCAAHALHQHVGRLQCATGARPGLTQRGRAGDGGRGQGEVPGAVGGRAGRRAPRARDPPHHAGGDVRRRGPGRLSTLHATPTAQRCRAARVPGTCSRSLRSV